MRTAFDPAGGPAGLVDKMIGSAFDTVLKVARELATIKYVAAHMGLVSSVAQTMQTTMPERTLTITGRTGSLGEMVELEMPAAVTVTNIRAIDVLLITPEGDVYGANSGHFVAGLQDGYLSLTLNQAAPITLVQAEIRWRLIYDATVT
ncbi:hypothetical protein [Roseococcus sp.]|uniref:hypothetical protein n=1 Tax=Roseococcus sp. TaxID=2109646 RepID=UPI003BA901B1